MAQVELGFENERKAGIVVDRIVQTFEIFERDGLDARLAGSLGKAASISREPNSYSSTRAKGGIKDIDVLFVGGDENQIRDALREASEVASPCKVDHMFPGIFSSDESGSYLSHREIITPINPRVLEVRQGRIRDIVVPTLDPNTLMHTNGFFAELNRRTFRNLHAFLRQIHGRKDILPEELFMSFHKMLRDVRETYYTHGPINRARKYYRLTVPEDVRMRLHPVTSPIKNLILRTP